MFRVEGSNLELAAEVRHAPGRELPLLWCLGFSVWCLGFGVWDVGCGVWGLGFGVWGVGFGVWG